MPSKVRRWLQKPDLDRRLQLRKKLREILAKVCFFAGPKWFAFYGCYLPDSYFEAGGHREFDLLLRRFLKHNAANNAGDLARLWFLLLNCKQAMEEGIVGDFAELGVWKGNTAAVLAHFAKQDHRRVFLFDTFAGFDSRDFKGVDSERQGQFSDTSINLVKEVIGDASDICQFATGYFPESIADEHRAARYSVVSIDCDLYEPMKEGLNFFYPRMTRGGLLLLHDYSSMYWAGAKQAVDEFCRRTGEFVILMPDKSGSALVRRTK